jgi:hypothetical protein
MGEPADEVDAPASVPADAAAGAHAAARADDAVSAAVDAEPSSAAPADRQADPWAAMLEAGAALLQGLASARAAGSASPFAIERDPVTGQASVRLPLPDPAVLQQLAKAFEPWLK